MKERWLNHLSNGAYLSGRRDSNPQPTAWKAVTLPLSYFRYIWSLSDQSVFYRVESGVATVSTTGACVSTAVESVAEVSVSVLSQPTRVSENIASAKINAFMHFSPYIVMKYGYTTYPLYPKRDLNPHVFQRQILSLVRLPISPFGHLAEEEGLEPPQPFGRLFSRQLQYHYAIPPFVSHLSDLNWWPADYKSAALASWAKVANTIQRKEYPLLYIHRNVQICFLTELLVGDAGFEPTTSRSQSERYTGLSQSPITIKHWIARNGVEPFPVLVITKTVRHISSYWKGDKSCWK